MGNDIARPVVVVLYTSPLVKLHWGPGCLLGTTGNGTVSLVRIELFESGMTVEVEGRILRFIEKPVKRDTGRARPRQESQHEMNSCVHYYLSVDTLDGPIILLNFLRGTKTPTGTTPTLSFYWSHVRSPILLSPIDVHNREWIVIVIVIMNVVFVNTVEPSSFSTSFF